MNFINRLVPTVSCLVILAMLTGGCTETEATHEEIVQEDLLIVIEALGAPCGKVIKYDLVEELSYSVHCETGDVYNISVNPEGRVLID